MQEYEIRDVSVTDLDNLIRFFKKAYGEDTIFSNYDFLKWYFNSRDDSEKYMEHSIIGLDRAGNVISHYGGLDYELKIGQEVYPIVWGVNAFTLPEWRGKGINSYIVEKINKDNEINGIIGFTDSTARFYDSIDYNVFNYKKFDRYVYVIDKENTYKIIDELKQDKSIIMDKFTDRNHTKERKVNREIMRIYQNNFKNMEVDFDVNIDITTFRDKNFINRRILENPFINYDVFGKISDSKLNSYIVCRKENLLPINIFVYRIIDLFGHPEACEELLTYAIFKASEEDCSYVEFSKFGSVYEKQLENTGFILLKDEEAEVLPFCTSPIEFRNNNERIGFSSRKHQDTINRMNVDDVYFTRIDSDRDRLAKMNQVYPKRG
jgi:hypothetical protein